MKPTKKGQLRMHSLIEKMSNFIKILYPIRIQTDGFYTFFIILCPSLCVHHKG